MKEFLERWAKLEPDRCEQMGEAEFYLTATNHLFVINFQDKRSGPKFVSALVQAAVQEALRERCWFWMLQRSNAGKQDVYALVVWKPGKPGKNNSKVATSRGSDEAPTLLEAYLGALEAQ